MTRILSDLLPLQVEPTRHRGIGQYAWHTIDALLKHNAADQTHLLAIHPDLPAPPPFTTEGAAWRVVNVDQPAADYRAEAWLAFQPAYADMWQRIIDANAVDVLFVHSPFELVAPPHSRPARARLVLTVFDLIPLIFADHYLKTTPPWYAGRYAQVCDLIRHADQIITISDCSRRDIMERLGVAPTRIRVAPPGPSAFVLRPPTPETERSMRQRWRLRDGFVLCTTGYDHRKNLPRALDAYARLPAPLRQAYPLVVVCRLSAVEGQSLRSEIRARKLGRQVVLTNYVSEEALSALYRMATVQFFPSLYEGFGLPVLDAMACGLPVITSNCSAMPEVAGDAAVLVDPCDVDAMAAALARVLESETLQAELRARGLAQAVRFEWMRTGQQLASILSSSA
ncbi:MAG: glycosyltransferase family 4 protein [Chloroflexi bacterium]|nr:glycosyltransferase family 4 protein [Chloroflexota bacterium]